MTYDLRPLRVVVAGGGVAAVETCLALRELAGERVDLVIVAPEPVFELRPAAVGEPFGVARAPRFDLSAVAADVGATLLRGTASAVEADRRRLLVDAWRPVEYDALVIAAGAAAIGSVPGAVRFGGPRDVPVVKACLDEVAAGATTTQLAFAIPSDTAWTLPAYELALLAATHLRVSAGGPARIGLVTPESAPLAAFGPHVSAPRCAACCGSATSRFMASGRRSRSTAACSTRARPAASPPTASSPCPGCAASASTAFRSTRTGSWPRTSTAACRR
jgi:sulfide:quinone oxidoreductase